MLVRSEVDELKFRSIVLKYSFLLRLISTVLLTVSIPVLIIVWFLLGNVYSGIEEQSNARMFSRIDSFSAYFENCYEDMFNTAIRIGYEKKILPAKIVKHPYNILDAIQEMSRYAKSVSIADDCLIFFNSSDYLISGTYKFNMEDFMKRFASDERMRDELSGALTESEELRVISDFDRAPMSSANMMFSIPVSIYQKHDAVVLWKLNRESVNKSFINLMGGGEYGICIFDDSNRMVFTNSGELSRRDNDGLSLFLSDSDTDVMDLKLSDNDYRLFKQFSKKLGLTFVFLVPQDELEEPLQSFYHALQSILIVLAVVFAVMFLATVYINYRPISTTAKELRSEGSSLNGTDEITTIKSAIRHMREEREQLTRLIDEQSTVLKEKTAQRIFDGNRVSGEEFSELQLPGPFWCAAVTDSSEKAELDSLAERTGLQLFAFRTERENYIAFLISLDRDGRDGMRESVEAIRRELPGEYGVGKLCSSAAELHSSAVNAVLAIENVRADIVFYDDIVLDRRGDAGIQAEMIRFAHSVKHGEEEKALEKLEQCLCSIRNYSNVNSIRRLYCSNLVYQFIGTAEKTENDLTESEVIELSGCSDVEELAEKMRPMVSRICREVSLANQMETIRRTEKVIKYVDDNFRDQGICLVMVSEHFGMSAQALSRTFKEVAGIGFKEYLTALRINESRRLLEETNIPVGEIARQMGYQDTSHFIKIFKSTCGLTPLGYRKESQKTT